MGPSRCSMLRGLVSKSRNRTRLLQCVIVLVIVWAAFANTSRPTSGSSRPRPTGVQSLYFPPVQWPTSLDRISVSILTSAATFGRVEKYALALAKAGVRLNVWPDKLPAHMPAELEPITFLSTATKQSWWTKTTQVSCGPAFTCDMQPLPPLPPKHKHTRAPRRISTRACRGRCTTPWTWDTTCVRSYSASLLGPVYIPASCVRTRSLRQLRHPIGH